MRRFVLLVAVSLAASVPSAAEAACGLFGFSSSIEEAGPVDLAALRVLLVVDDPGAAGPTKITGCYQVGFAGGYVSMGFVLPFPALPDEVEVTDPELFDQLDAVTAPVLEYPVGSGCGMTCSAGGAGNELAAVEVYATGSVGPYEYAVLQGADAGPVMDWLASNGFMPPPGLAPVLQTYVDAGFYFLAVRMSPDIKDRALPPICASYYGETPILPTRLAAMGNAGEIGLVVHVVGPERFRPSNFAEIVIDPETLWVNDTGETNYFERVSEVVDAAGGRAFVTELATPLEGWAGTEALGADARKLLARGAFLTRLYTRLSPEELMLDAAFERGGLDPVSNRVPATYAPRMEASASFDVFAILGAAAFAAVRARRRKASRRTAP